MKEIYIADPIAKARQRILQELQILQEIIESSPNKLTTLDISLMHFIEQRIGAKILIFEDATSFSQEQKLLKKSLGAWDCLLFSSKYPGSNLEESLSNLTCLALGLDSAIAGPNRLLIYVMRHPVLASYLGLDPSDPKIMDATLAEPTIRDWLSFLGLEDVQAVSSEIADLHTEFLSPFDDFES
jgi:hypothetical protein